MKLVELYSLLFVTNTPWFCMKCLFAAQKQAKVAEINTGLADADALVTDYLLLFLLVNWSWYCCKAWFIPD